VVEKWSEVEYSGVKLKFRVENCHVFIGEYQNSIDPKNRIIVPSKFREELGSRFILTKGLDNCLYIYPMDEWKKFQDKLTALLWQ
jgi:division/cell wall cluster transcriptional repressor MraZ